LKSALDTLRPFLAGSEVLDLYAGQGRFGLSTLREGARQVTLVEQDSRLVGALRGQIQQMGAHIAAEVVANDVFQFLKTTIALPRYDLVFADPPFPFWNPKFSGHLFAAVRNVLNRRAIFLVKTPARMIVSPPNSNSGYSLWKSSPFGESKLIYFNYEESSKTEEKAPTCHE
jgi:16S rRNA G966 N2-methylase RsmD